MKILILVIMCLLVACNDPNSFQQNVKSENITTVQEHLMPKKSLRGTQHRLRFKFWGSGSGVVFTALEGGTTMDFTFQFSSPEWKQFVIKEDQGNHQVIHAVQNNNLLNTFTYDNPFNGNKAIAIYLGLRNNRYAMPCSLDTSTNKLGQLIATITWSDNFNKNNCNSVVVTIWYHQYLRAPSGFDDPLGFYNY